MTIEKVPGGFKIRSESKGTLYPKKYLTKEEAQARLKQLLMFKHMKQAGTLRNK